MKKKLMLLFLLFGCIATAKSQNITAAEYFIDTDPGKGNGTSISIGAPGDIVNFTASIPTVSLSSGFHFVGIRLQDVNGIWSHFEKRSFYLSTSTSDVGDIVAAEYFFDADPGNGNGTALSVGTSGPTVNFSVAIPTALSSGFHFLAIRLKNADGKWGLFEKRVFYISPATTDVSDIVAAEYFFDADPGKGNATALSVGASGPTVNFSVAIPTALSSGFHFLAIRLKDGDGKWGLFERRVFYISTATTDAGNITAAEYFIDSDPGIGNGTSVSIGASGASVNFTATIPTAIAAGFHFLAIRTKDADGKWGLFEKRVFYISPTTTDVPVITAAEYFINSDPGVGNATPLTITTPGDVITQTFSITPALPLGSYNLGIRLKGQDGKWGLYEFRQFNIGNSTISCPANATVTAGTGQCTAVVNNIDPTINPPQSYNYSFSGATTGSGSGTASGKTFNSGTTTVTYSLTGSPSVSCSFTVTVTPTAPSINTQPTNQSACVGGNVTFSVGATGSGLTYQWRKNGINIGDATSSTFTINGVAAGDAGNYDVVVSIPCSLSTTSVTVSLTVGSTTINTQPESQAVCAGTNVTFNVSASGVGLTFQWRKGGNNISGATLSTYTINNVAAGDAGNYDVVVTGSCGNATSNIATLTLNAATQIGTNPSNQTVCSGGNATFSVSATGAGTLTYQWRKGGVNISGATSSTYTINPATAGDAGNYDVIVNGTCGPVTSAAASLTVNAVTVINTQPTNQSSCIGGSVTFSVSAVGTNLTYQWKKDGVDIGGAISSTYTINPVSAGDAATYTVVVTGTCGTVTSNAATLTLSAGTVINTQPVSQSACLGSSVTFSVSASGSGTVTYQWRKGGVNIGGATSSSYTINPVTPGDAANYDVAVSSLCGNTTSSAATLSILPTTSIGTQPTNQTVCSGSNATFTVVASGDNLTYQWRKGGNNISGATSSSFTITGVGGGDVSNYDVVITGTCGTATSNTVSLALGNVVISTQPASQTVCAGTNVTLVVTANGLGLSYQWRKGGVNINAATSSSYTITGVAIGDAGSYDVVVGGTCGPVTSNAATLNVNTSPVINTQPIGQTLCAGGNVTFSVAATGTGLTYQWRKGGNNISGATTSSYNINNVVAGDAGNYDVVVSGTCSPAVTSAVAVLTVNQAPTITTQPQSQATFVGSSSTLNVVATGTGLTYQWRKGGVNITGATLSTYTINPLAIGDAGNYDVIITGTCSPSVTSSVAVLTVSAVSITTQPANQSACVGSNATFTVVANGNNLTYQWQVSSGGGPFTNISGAASGSLTLNGVTQTMNGNQYRVVVGGSLNSNAATLTVNPLPVVTLNLPFDTLYLNSPLQTLSGGSPAGATGIYSGIGISGTNFMPGALTLGNYTATYRYTDANGCTSAATDVFTIIPKADNVNIFPNPAKDGNVTIVTSLGLIGGNATVYDLMGRKVYQWTVDSRLSTYRFKWSAGIYTFIFRKGDVEVTKQFIIGR